jgi:hypothetical protein
MAMASLEDSWISLAERGRSRTTTRTLLGFLLELESCLTRLLQILELLVDGRVSSWLMLRLLLPDTGEDEVDAMLFSENEDVVIVIHPCLLA